MRTRSSTLLARLAELARDELPFTPPVNAGHPEPPPTVVAAPPIDEVLDRAIIDVIVEPLAPAEPASAGYRRKEAELRALFDRLSPSDAYALRDRLTGSTPVEAIGAAFLRLTTDRRERLLACLTARVG